MLLFYAFCKSEFRTRRVPRTSPQQSRGVQAGSNQAAAPIMEDFDNDGLIDLVVPSWANSESMSFYRNKGEAKVGGPTKDDRAWTSSAAGCMRAD